MCDLIKHTHPNSVPELLVLNDCDIDQAGEPDDLAAKCCSVKELDLAQNKLQNWQEVFTILAHMPRVEFVNLSLNRLCGPVERPPAMRLAEGAGCTGAGLGCIRNLVLNNTRLDWDGVDTIINMLPVLEELHLSLNDYRNVLIDTIDDDYVANCTMDVEDDEEEEVAGGVDVPADLCTCGDKKKATKRSMQYLKYSVFERAFKLGKPRRRLHIIRVQENHRPRGRAQAALHR